MKIGLGKAIIFCVVCAALCVYWIAPKPAHKAIGQLSLVTRADGAKISYYQSGPKTGQRVLLLASLGRSVSDYNALVTALNDAGYRTLAVDVRGVGRSKLAPDQKPLDLFGLAQDISSAVKDSGSQGKIVVIGHAFGNRLARTYATQYPHTTKSLVLIAAGGSQKLDPEQRITQALINSFNWKLLPPKRGAEIKYAFFADENTVPSTWKRGWYKPAAELQIGAVRSTPLEQWRAGGGQVPILVLQAAQDRIAPAALTSQKLKTDFPKRVHVVTIEGAGHALLPEQPKIIAEEIINFINLP
jgi:pimeloyl-ACP methyl ester carboxylesterase